MSAAREQLGLLREFMSELKRACSQGFFEAVHMESNLFDNEATLRYIRISLVGYIPSSNVPKQYSVFPPEDVEKRVTSLLEHAFNAKKDVSLRIPLYQMKSHDWPLFDQMGEKILGSRGSQFHFSLCVELQRERLKK